MKKQHRQALLLDNFLGVDGLALGRSLRDRKPVTYTFGKKFYHCWHFVFSAELASSFSSFFSFLCMYCRGLLDASLFLQLDCCVVGMLGP